MYQSASYEMKKEANWAIIGQTRNKPARNKSDVSLSLAGEGTGEGEARFIPHFGKGGAKGDLYLIVFPLSSMGEWSFCLPKPRRRHGGGGNIT